MNTTSKKVTEFGHQAIRLTEGHFISARLILLTWRGDCVTEDEEPLHAMRPHVALQARSSFHFPILNCPRRTPLLIFNF